ncbi:ion channel protein [Escherichia coli]|nr:ion channel protein [Escherichia coli]
MLHPRARTMLLLSLPAVAIGIASSLILIVVMKIASALQNLLWQRLPGTLGIAQDSPLWIIGVLTLTGIAVGLVIRFSQGHAGPDPACEPLIGAPVPPSALPGLIVALILGLAGGVSLGPEHPIMTVNIALAVAIGARLLPRVNRMEWTILASAGTIGALFGTPVAAALIFSQTLNGSSDGGFILGILGVIGGPVSLFKGLDEMQQMVANQAFSTSDYFLLAVIKLAALVVAAASGFRGGRIFPAVFVGVALGLMLHEHVPAVPAAITVSCAILGIVLVVTRDGWLSLFMAAVVVPNTTLLPLLCIVMLPAWLLLAGKPMMMVNRPKQQPPHDNV